MGLKAIAGQTYQECMLGRDASSLDLRVAPSIMADGSRGRRRNGGGVRGVVGVAVAGNGEAAEVASLAPRRHVAALAVANLGASAASRVVRCAGTTGLALGIEGVLVVGVAFVLVVLRGEELRVSVLEPVGDDLALDGKLGILVAVGIVKVAVDGRIAADAVALARGTEVDHRALVLGAPLFERAHVMSANGLLADVGALVLAMKMRAAALVAVAGALFGGTMLVFARKTAVSSLNVDLETASPGAFVAADMSASAP